MRKSEKRNEKFGGTEACRSFAAETDRETKRNVQSRDGKGRIVYQYVGIAGDVLVELVMCRRRRRGREIDFHPCLEKIVCTSCFSLCCLLQTV